MEHRGFGKIGVCAAASLMALIQSNLAVAQTSCAFTAPAASSSRDATALPAKALDGSSTTAWRSAPHASAVATEWFSIEVAGGSSPVRAVRITPRSASIFTFGTPVELQVTDQNGQIWHGSAMPAAAGGRDIVVPLAQPVPAGTITLTGTRFHGTAFGQFGFDIAEIAPECGDEYAHFVWKGRDSDGHVRFENLGSVDFDPAKIWNLNSDIRHPLIDALADFGDQGNPNATPKALRNIYAANLVKVDDTWRIYYHGWDGFDQGDLDTVLLVTTPDFDTFSERVKLIVPDPVSVPEVGNPIVQRIGEDDWYMQVTTLPVLDANPLLWRGVPGYATSTDGLNWIASNNAPFTMMSRDHWLDFDGSYPIGQGLPPNGGTANINAGKAVLYEAGVYHMVFQDLNSSTNPPNGTGWYYASSTDGVVFDADTTQHANADHNLRLNPVDFKRFTYNGQPYYLVPSIPVGSTAQLSVSTDPTTYAASTAWFSSTGQNDSILLSVGIVQEGNRMLGVLYGGMTSLVLSLDGRIYAKWLQKKVELRDPVNNSSLYAGNKADGPDTVVVDLGSRTMVQGQLGVYDTDGLTPFGGAMPELTVLPGDRFEYIP